MPEVITRLLPRASLPTGQRAVSAKLQLEVLPQRAIVQLQVSARALPAAIGTAIAGAPLLGKPNTWVGSDPVICWIAPDAWLVHYARLENQNLAATVRSACAALPCAITDLSDALVTIALEGPDSRAVLTRGCGLDLSPTAFGTKTCARTRLAQCQVLVRHVAPARFELVVDRSLARYLHDWLLDAAAGLE